MLRRSLDHLSVPVAVLLLLQTPLSAATITVTGFDSTVADDGLCTLREAIVAGNTDTASGVTLGECAAGAGDDTISLTGDVSLTIVDNTIDGPNGLPSVTSTLEINGNGFRVRRDGAAPNLRIAHIGASGDLTLDHLRVENGLVTGDDDGGGLRNAGGKLTLSHSTVSGNKVSASATSNSTGGGIASVGGELILSHSTISGNRSEGTTRSARAGGVWSSQETATISDTSIYDNHADSSGSSGVGGGVFVSESILVIRDSSVRDNSALGTSLVLGGGLVARTTSGKKFTMINTTVSGNSATGGSTTSGGGIYLQGNAATPLPGLIVSSTLSGNHVTGRTVGINYGGGGLGIVYGEVELRNVTISNNSVSLGTPAPGGGLMAYGSDVKLTQSTLSGNSAVTGGALYAWPGNSITVTGSVIANSAGGNCTGTITDNGGSRADDASCSTIPNTLTGLNATLAANGGPTMTHALMAGSSAIDAAGACGLATDQRGALRPAGPSCDSGSYEFGAILPLPGLSRWGLAALTTLSLLALSLAGIRHRNRSSIG